MRGSRNYRDIVGGLLIVLLGVAVAVYAGSRYSFGSVNRMGPGFYPTVLGIGLAGLGVLVTIPAIFQAGTSVQIHWRPTAWVLAGLLLFAATLRTAGLVPAVVLLTAASAMADTKLGVVGIAILSVCLAAATYLIFVVGLGIVLQPIRNPF